MADAAPAPSEGGTPAPPAKPDYVPDAFWNTQNNEVDVQGLATKYTELSQRFGKGKEALIPEVKEQVTKEIFGKRPEKPEAYKFAEIKEGPLAERLAKAGLVLSDKKEGVSVEQGKRLYHINTEGPLFKKAQQLAYDAGKSNDEFMDLVAFYAETDVQKADARDKEYQEALKANRASLGENADKRIEFLKGRLDAMVPDAAKALGFDDMPASGIKALEALMEKAGAPKFAPENAGQSVSTEDMAALLQEKRDLMQSNDYFESQAKQDRVDQINKRLGVKRSTPGSRYK